MPLTQAQKDAHVNRIFAAKKLRDIAELIENGDRDLPAIPFNINGTVRVKLTDKGRAILKQQYEKLKLNCLSPPVDAEGWSTWQMWDLMARFGEHMSLGFDVPFYPDIELLP